MKPSFDPGYVAEPFVSLCNRYPDSSVYPRDKFLVEWGPSFHRGRLDGSARVLVIGQDPAAHEAVARRILIGEAGRRVQGFLAKLGITSSYVMINTFLYTGLGDDSRTGHKNDPAIIEYRNRWLDALFASSPIEAVIALGTLANDAFHKWKTTPSGKGNDIACEHIMHPTYPEGASKGNASRRAELTKQLLSNWNAGLQRIGPRIRHPDDKWPLVLYGDAFAASELVEIPARDLPAGLPPWMRSLDVWAEHKGATNELWRATMVVTVPENARR